jgi:hypothetical protein
VPSSTSLRARLAGPALPAPPANPTTTTNPNLNPNPTGGELLRVQGPAAAAVPQDLLDRLQLGLHQVAGLQAGGRLGGAAHQPPRLQPLWADALHKPVAGRQGGAQQLFRCGGGQLAAPCAVLPPPRERAVCLARSCRGCPTALPCPAPAAGSEYCAVANASQTYVGAWGWSDVTCGGSHTVMCMVQSERQGAGAAWLHCSTAAVAAPGHTRVAPDAQCCCPAPLRAASGASTGCLRACAAALVTPAPKPFEPAALLRAPS